MAVTFKTPWNFQLPQTRPMQVKSFSDVEAELDRLYATFQQLFLAINLISGNFEVIFSEAVAFGALINLYSNAGVLNARNANSGVGGSSGAVQPVHGFCNGDNKGMNNIASGKSGFVQLGKGMILGQTGLTVGGNYWLKATNGQWQATPDVTAGHIEQYIGVALSATQLAFGANSWIQH